jgi:hypothetical protein
MSTFSFNLQDRVKIAASGEAGKIVGGAEYVYGDPQYLLRYKANDGRAVEQWWASGALGLADAPS